jgi:hypothetical protein
MLKIKHNPNMATPVKVKEIDLILDQYQRIANRISELFMILSEKIGAEWQSDGIGSCGDSPTSFGHGLTGDLEHYLPKLWEEVARDLGGEKTLGGFDGVRACPYHAKDEGCILGDIKPARCVSFIEQPDISIRVVLGESRGTLERFFSSVLTDVMIGTQAVKFPDFLVNPAGNETYVLEVLARVDAMIEKADAYTP